jgi:hypothetical protein
MTSRLAALASSLIFAFTLACGDSSDERTVTDQAGRTCTIPPSGSLTIDCDATPMPKSACSGSATACFVTGVVDSSTAMIGPAAVCAACCEGNQSTSSEGDCSQIVCKTVDDCPLGSSECKDGGCY